ncbi:MAG: GxxExxY protein [Bacteroidales bacterium]|nr:GxxExxY protein [Bacteroidales bacterium]
MHLECLKELSYEIRGAAMNVYNELGPGLLESVYEKALIHEFKLREIDVVSQIPVNIVYKGEVVGNDLRLDLLVDDTVVIELKSVEELKKVHFKQLRTYLKLLNKPEGWLMNFGAEDFVKGMVRIINYDFRQ